MGNIGRKVGRQHRSGKVKSKNKEPYGHWKIRD